MTAVLVMIPAGEVYDYDCVRWYDYRNVQKSINHYHNIGDAFVYDSSLKLLSYDRLDVLNIEQVVPEDIDRLRNEFDYVFLRGSNYIHASMNWRRAEEVLQRLKLPVLAFGIGAQAPSKGELVLSEQTKQVLHLMADSSASVGVRGAYTAEVLWRHGIKNVRIVGCPTAFRNLDPNLQITLPPLEQVREVGVTVRREVSPNYAPDVERYLTFHRDLVKEVAARFEVVLMAQGEVEEKAIVLGTEEQKAAALKKLREHGWASQWYMDDAIEQLYRTRLFYSDVVADYEQLVRQKNLVLGYRLHGNLMALANSVPSIYFTYDSRTTEFAETFAIPSHNVFGQRRFEIEDYWNQALFDRFNRAYYACYREMRTFLDENGIAHKMRADGAAAAAARRVA
jgi:Polysaccharide pyruvyl transferase